MGLLRAVVPQRSMNPPQGCKTIWADTSVAKGSVEAFRNLVPHNFCIGMNTLRRSHWPRRLRLSSAADRLLGLWVIKYRSLLRADHSCRGVLPSVVCPVNMIWKPVCGGNDPESCRSATEKKKHCNFYPSSDVYICGNSLRSNKMEHLM